MRTQQATPGAKDPQAPAQGFPAGYWEKRLKAAANQLANVGLTIQEINSLLDPNPPGTPPPGHWAVMEPGPDQVRAYKKAQEPGQRIPRNQAPGTRPPFCELAPNHRALKRLGFKNCPACKMRF